MNQDRTVRLYVKSKGIEQSGVSKATVAIKGGKPANALFAQPPSRFYPRRRPARPRAAAAAGGAARAPHRTTAAGP